jgi:hypothetical protein
VSLCCAWVDQERAIVVTDTLGALAHDGSEIHMTKVGIFPHMNALAVVLGNTDLINVITYIIAPLQGEYDLLIDNADQVVADACNMYRERVEFALMHPEQAFLFAGWSRKESRIVAIYGTWREGQVATRRVSGNFAQPAWPGYSPEPMNTAAALQKAAAGQIEHFSGQPQTAGKLGGRLIVAEVAAARITLDNVPIPGSARG